MYLTPLIQGVNKNTAKKLVESISRQYMNAKRASHEYEGVIRGLNRSNISVPLVGSVQELQQVGVLCSLLFP